MPSRVFGEEAPYLIVLTRPRSTDLTSQRLQDTEFALECFPSGSLYKYFEVPLSLLNLRSSYISNLTQRFSLIS